MYSFLHIYTAFSYGRRYHPDPPLTGGESGEVCTFQLIQDLANHILEPLSLRRGEKIAAWMLG